MSELKYLAAYASELQAQVRSMLAQDKLGAYLQQR
ncbi:MAG: metal-dependent hydrolase, partial [Gammaproteobacteria bacterium]|nr:metal-dependent hydrolase [Gammaproteobacteria bacterium]